MRDKTNRDPKREMKRETDGNEKKPERKILGSEGELIYVMTKIGQVIILNLLWLVSCIPIITIGTATTSLYYAMMKNIRRNRSYPTTEYIASFKRTFLSGSILTAALAVWLFVLYHLRLIALDQGTGTGAFLSRIYITVMVVTAGIAVYLFPVLSRFTMKLSSMVKLAFVMAVRYIGFTILILAGTGVLAWLIFRYLPMATILFLPGMWCYVCTFMIERALRKYMPKPDGNEDAWYYE
ncbi:MAG: DUF624 domain-containing protein [Lachnospiraceae bacterium]|nr:DUF624 domain-containing protein [Lachnospiraceae bacterium]